MGPSPRTLSAILHTVLLDSPDAPYQDKAFPPIASTVAGAEPDRAAKKRRPVPLRTPFPSYITYNTVAEIHQTAGYSTFCHKISRQYKRGIAIMDTESRAVNIRWGTTAMGTSKHSRDAMVAAPKETEIGTPIISNTIMVPNKIIAVMTHPPFPWSSAAFP